MKPKLVLTISGVIGVLAVISASYCFWLMDHPLSYRWVPIVITGFLLAIFLFIVALITFFVALARLRRSSLNPPEIRPNI